MGEIKSLVNKLGSITSSSMSTAETQNTPDTVKKEAVVAQLLSPEGKAAKTSESQLSGEAMRRALTESFKSSSTSITNDIFVEKYSAVEKKFEIKGAEKAEKVPFTPFEKCVDLKKEAAFQNLSEAKREKLVQEMSKDSVVADKLQRTMNHPTYAKLTLEEKTKLLNVFVESSPQGREALLPLMSRQIELGNPPNKIPALLTTDNTKQQKTLLDHLDSAATQKLAPELESRRQELLTNLIQETGRPSHYVHQGWTDNCVTATVEVHLLKHSPAEYARIVNGLASPEKSITLADGSKMEAAQNQDNKFTIEGKEYRSLTDRMFQAAAMQFGKRIPESKGPGYKFDANTDSSLNAFNTARLMKGLYNREYTPAEYTPELYKKIEEHAKAGNGPIPVGLEWGVDSRIGHMVLVQKVENGRVYFWNALQAQDAKLRASYVNGKEFNEWDSPKRRVENAQNKLESMPIDEFKKIAVAAVFGPPVGGE
jgi:hypothetical protein